VTQDNPACLPQDPHSDYNVEMVKDMYNSMLLKPMIAFCPLHQDGCIMLICVDDYNAFQLDHKDLPGEYYLYIPFGVLVILPGDITHAGGFCFSGEGQDIGLPDHLKDFTNHQLHFFLCPNAVSYHEVYAEDKADLDAAKQKNKDRKKRAMEEIPHPPIDPKYKLEMPKFAKLSKAILATLSSDEEDDQSNNSSNDSDKKPAAKKKKWKF